MIYTMTMKRISVALGILAIALLGAFVILAPSATAPKQTFGATNTSQLIGGFPYFLAGSGISSSGTSITLTSLTLPQTGYKVLTTDLGNPFYVTIEPGSTSRQEFASCTTVVQNANNTATLSGCVRGLLPISPYTANSQYAFSHSGGTTLIFSNSPQFYQQFYALGNMGTSTNSLVFSSTTPPHYDSVAAQGSGTYISTTSELASVAYVNAIAIAGAANATAAVKGIVQLATAFQAASSTATGSTGASLVLPVSIATDTPQSNGGICNSTIFGRGGCVIMSDLTGKIRQGWLDLTASFAWSGIQTWAALGTFNGGLTSSATTTLAGSNVNSNALILNTLKYAFPSSGIASSTVWAFDATGKATFEPQQAYVFGQFSTSSSITTTGAFTVTTNIGYIPKQIHISAKCGTTATQAGASSEGDINPFTLSQSSTYTGGNTSGQDGSDIIRLTFASNPVIASITAVTANTMIVNLSSNGGCGGTSYYQWEAYE